MAYGLLTSYSALSLKALEPGAEGNVKFAEGGINTSMSYMHFSDH
jgi:hypothetical protein